MGSLSEPGQNPSGGGTWTAVQTTGIDVQKLAAGSDATALSPNVNSPSPFDSTKFNLVSGGTVYNIDTTSTGLATMGQTTITGVLATQALQMVVGMLWSPANNAAGQQLFPTGTTIVSIAPDGSGMGTYTITMSAAATATGSPGKAGVGGSFAFVGSQYTSATTPTGQPTTTPGSIPVNSNIMTIDPNIGMYLRPGMMVTGKSDSRRHLHRRDPWEHFRGLHDNHADPEHWRNCVLGALHLRWSTRFLCSPDADQQLVRLGRLLCHPIGFGT